VWKSVPQALRHRASVPRQPRLYSQPRLHNRFYFDSIFSTTANYPLSEGGHWKDKICIPNVPDCDRNLPILIMGDFPQWGRSGFNGSENPIYSFNDDLTWTRGKHVLKAGYLHELAPYVGLGQQAGPGKRHLQYEQHSAARGRAIRNTGGGIGFASFLAGEAGTATINTPRRVGMRWRYHAMYFQDDWRRQPALSINLGIAL